MKICNGCEYVKKLDAEVGRCLIETEGMLFCKLKEPKHVCDRFKKKKEG